MKLVEKKCPNCGAGLSFNDTDKSCKCEYCKRSFEIERDSNFQNGSYEYEYNLNEVSKPFKFFFYIIFFTIFAFVIGIFFFVSSQIFGNVDGNDFSIEDISDGDMSIIDKKSKSAIAKQNFKLNEYKVDGNVERVKFYFATDTFEDKNLIISVYRVNYSSKTGSNDTYTVYIPVKFNTVKKNNFSSIIIDAPDYCFDSGSSNCVKGFNSLDEFNEKVIDTLEQDYDIIEK